MTLPAKQQGMTLIGFIFVLAFMLIIAYLGIKIVPIYLNYFSIVDGMEKVALEPGIGSQSNTAIMRRLQSVLYVNYSEGLDASNLVIVRTREGKEIRLNYESREPIVANLSVCIEFHKAVALR